MAVIGRNRTKQIQFDKADFKEDNISEQSFKKKGCFFYYSKLGKFEVGRPAGYHGKRWQITNRILHIVEERDI